MLWSAECLQPILLGTLNKKVNKTVECIILLGRLNIKIVECIILFGRLKKIVPTISNFFSFTFSIDYNSNSRVFKVLVTKGSIGLVFYTVWILESEGKKLNFSRRQKSTLQLLTFLLHLQIWRQ